MQKILAIDEGTSSVRALLFSETGEVLDVAQEELGLIYPHDGWVEQNPEEIISKTLSVMRQVLERVDDLSTVVSAGITNQRETVIVWNRHTGQPIYNAIVWQDRRTAEYCKQLKVEGVENLVREKTGLLLDPYFSATKIKWILDTVEGAQESALNGDLLCGTVDCYVIWHLTKGREHVTDITNASRTLLYDIIGQKWSSDLLKIFNIQLSMLPTVKSNVSDFGVIESDVIGLNLSIKGVAGDQQSALIGQGCFQKGMVKSTYGTGCFMLMIIGAQALLSENKLLTTIGFKIGNEISYAFEGAIFNAGTAVQFLRDNFGFFDNASESEDLALSVSDNGGVYFVPAFTGLGAPYWEPDARGVLCGLSRDTSRAHIVRAALEAQAYQTRDLMDAMRADSGLDIRVLRADGGLVANHFMCQFLADMLDVEIQIPKVREATAWGAACLAGLGAGVFENLEHVAKVWQNEKTYRSSMKQDERIRLYSEWKAAVLKSY